MELANVKFNKFFTPKEEDNNRYYIESFDANNTKGTNNVWMLTKEIVDGTIVIDIGCSQGNFGKILKEKNCMVYGIEKNKITAEIALKSGYYEDVFVTDLMNLESSEYERFLKKVPYADAIIISDVLEHLVEPTKVLINYSKLLQNNGIMLISVPNIAHIDIILNLLNGKFNYTDLGILDNTHLKFFTKSSFIEWIVQINNVYNDLRFDCEYLGSTFYNNEYTKEIEKNYPELFGILEQCENYNSLQILFKLKKLSINEETENVEKLILEPTRDIVSTFGEILKNIFKSNNIPKIVEGERLWYDMQLQQLKDGIIWHQNNDIESKKYIQQLENRVKELEDGIAWHQNNDIESKKYTQQLENRAKELENGIAWHQNNDIESKKYTQQLKNRVKELEDGITWHIKNDDEKNKNIISMEEKLKISENKNNLLRAKIYKMETSFSWKITKWMRRNSEEGTR